MLADLLERARARAGVFATTSLAAPWGLDMGDGLPMTIHIVLDGDAWIDMPGEESRWARAGDVVLVAGKGHETYQIIGTESHYFSDQQVVREFLQVAA